MLCFDTSFNIIVIFMISGILIGQVMECFDWSNYVAFFGTSFDIIVISKCGLVWIPCLLLVFILSTQK